MRDRGADGGAPASPDGALSAVRVVEPLFGQTVAIEPSAGWTSPPPCAQQYENTFCESCYEWTSGPASLDRDADGDRFGESMAIADFNNDGYPDLAVGAPGEDVGSNVDAGAVYVYLGTSRGFEPWRVLHYESGLGTALAGLGFGTQLAAGDFNEDGFADLAIALGPNDTEQTIYVLQGVSYGLFPYLGIPLGYVDPDSWEEDDSEFGAAMTFTDVDQDGHLDLVIGAPAQYVDADSETTGAVYIVPGDGADLDMFSATRLVPSSLSTISAGMRFGEVIAVGEMTGGGDLDVAVGVSSEEGVYVYESGSTALVVLELTGRTGLGASLTAGDTGTDGVAELFAGGTGTTYVSGFFDLDAMGAYDTWDLDDALIGATVGLADLEAPGTEQLLVRWSDTGFVTNPVVGVADLGGTAVAWAFHIGESVPRESADAFGRRVIVEDVDGDGRTDVVVAAPSAAGQGAGRVYVFGVESSSEWTDTMHWEAVWDEAGYEYLNPGDPPYTDPMPVQVVTQETTPGDCDLCHVFAFDDGVACGETSAEICVEGACFTRGGCGDGYREPAPGTTEWPREGCDDGNTSDGDACTSMCVPARLVVSSQPFEDASPARRGPAIGEDGTGELLFVYVADVGDTRELRARRYSRGGVAHEEDTSPIVLATGPILGWDLRPSVAGRPEGGWMVGWSDPTVDGDGAGIAVRRVNADGTLGPIRVANDQRRGSQRDPRIFAFEGGYGAAWVDEGGVDGPLGGSIVKLRAFMNSGGVFIDELALSPTDGVASEPAVAMGEGLLILWSEAAADEAELSYVIGRRFGDGLGASFVVSGPGGAQPAVEAVPGSPAFVVAWVRRDPAYDFLGDIMLTILDATSEPPVVDFTTAVVERGTGEPPHAELAPSIALTGDGAVIAYEDGGHRRGLAFAPVFSTLASESTALADYVTDGLQGDVTLLRTSRGVWFAWSDASGFGDTDAYRSFLAFLLPHD